MSVNSFKLTFRYLKKNLSVSLINIIGLIIAFSVVIPLGLYVVHESSYDKWYKDVDRICRLVMEGTIGADQRIAGAMTSARMPIDIKNEIPEIEDYVRIDPWSSERPITVNNNTFYESNLLFADSSFFNVFGYNLILGDPDEVLTSKYSAVITESTAKKYFGDDNPIGEKLMFNYNADRVFTVTGVMEDITKPTHIPEFSMVCSWVTYRSEIDDTPWLYNIDWITYFKLKEGVSPRDLDEKLNLLMEKHAGEFLREIGSTLRIYMQPMSECYLGSSSFNYVTFNIGSKANVIQFFVIAISILIIAVFNFINLTTAKSMNRGRQVGISKVLGATRYQLIKTQIIESIMISVFAATVALIISSLFIEQFSILLDANLELSPVKNINIIFIIITSSASIGLIAGLYPAILITGFSPVKVMRGQLKTGQKGKRLRSAFVVLQYTISITLILSTLLVLRQLNFMRHKDLGFDQEQIMVLKFPSRDLMKQHETIQNEILQLTGVVASASADQMPHHTVNNNVYHLPGKPSDDQIFCAGQRIDADYLNLIGWTLIDGRNFDKSIASDSVNGVILNETAQKMFGLDKTGDRYIEQIVDFTPLSFEELEVIGVVKDYHFADLYEKIRPMVIRTYEGDPPYLFFKLAPGNIAATMTEIQNVWESFAPGTKMDYTFLDQIFADAYKKEEVVSRLFTFFMIIAVIVASMGLFALAAFNAEQRTREIGVRKVVGASIANIINMLVWQFLKLILISIIFAWPLALFIINKWMENFAYKAEIGWWLFPLSGLTAMVISIATVSTQAWKTANINPVKSLKVE